MNQARIADAFDAAKVRLAGDAAVGVNELGVVDDVEELSAELQARPLGQFRLLEHRDIEVVDARPAADGTRGVSDRAGPTEAAPPPVVAGSSGLRKTGC